MNDNGVISDQVWAWMQPLLPSTKGKRGGQFRDHRRVIEGIAFKYRTGVPWRDVPERFGPYQTLWYRHDAWSHDGTWQRLLAAAQARADADGQLDWLGVGGLVAGACPPACRRRPPEQHRGLRRITRTRPTSRLITRSAARGAG